MICPECKNEVDALYPPKYICWTCLKKTREEKNLKPAKCIQTSNFSKRRFLEMQMIRKAGIYPDDPFFDRDKHPKPSDTS
ncbi:MAG: hypothetical protein BV459_07990 [Thermoplasmata archaeon M11B2D]|nr:MAG: hypothetical protein BV459_07990 [Thermoplasmata archaeon M11B2D]